MFKKNLLLLMALIITMFTIGGCGSDSNETTGSITVAATSVDLTGGRYEVTIIATYSNPTRANLTRTPISIHTSTHTLTGVPAITDNNLESDSTGAVTKVLRVNQTTEPIYVDIRATTGGLSASTSTSIPAL